MSKLCEEIWPQLKEKYMSMPSLKGRPIPTPTNKYVDEINHMVTWKLPGPEMILLSAETITE